MLEVQRHRLPTLLRFGDIACSFRGLIRLEGVLLRACTVRAGLSIVLPVLTHILERYPTRRKIKFQIKILKTCKLTEVVSLMK